MSPANPFDATPERAELARDRPLAPLPRNVADLLRAQADQRPFVNERTEADHSGTVYHWTRGARAEGLTVGIDLAGPGGDRAVVMRRHPQGVVEVIDEFATFPLVQRYQADPSLRRELVALFGGERPTLRRRHGRAMHRAIVRHHQRRRAANIEAALQRMAGRLMDRVHDAMTHALIYGELPLPGTIHVPPA